MEVSEVILSNMPSQSGHWYSPKGEPAYTTIGANGKERATTLRDARKEGYVPSVTTILKVAANEGLNRWLKSNLLMAAATLPRVDGESADEWIARVVEDAQRQSQEAMQLGTSIHASLEKSYEGLDWPKEHDMYVATTVSAIEKHFPKEVWNAEKSFAHAIGFGGKIDLASDRVVIDFKTSAFDADKKDVGGYDEHIMQLAAYARGLGIEYPRCANVYVSTTVPGLVRVTEYAPEDIDKGWKMFRHLLHYWQAKNKYEVKP
jgi:hypothetical protein